MLRIKYLTQTEIFIYAYAETKMSRKVTWRRIVLNRFKELLFICLETLKRLSFIVRIGISEVLEFGFRHFQTEHIPAMNT